MQMNPGLILANRQPDLVGALRQGQLAGQEANQIQTQNALAGLYREQGAQIRQGDPNALNALAGIDPGAALGVQQAHHGMQMDTQRMGIAQESLGLDRQRLEIAKQEAARLAQAQAMNMSAAERDQEARQMQAAAVALSQAQDEQQ